MEPLNGTPSPNDVLPSAAPIFPPRACAAPCAQIAARPLVRRIASIVPAFAQ
jgi:hypothetical protein